MTLKASKFFIYAVCYILLSASQFMCFIVYDQIVLSEIITTSSTPLLVFMRFI